MGKVSNFLTDLVVRQVEETGIVVWYDPEGHYQQVAGSLDTAGARVFMYDGSALRLRAQLDPLLEFVSLDGRFSPSPEIPPRMVVYVPKASNQMDRSLIELELIGAVMEPGAASLPRNTRLEVVARHALRKLMPPDQVEAICQKVAEGYYRLEDLDRLADQGPGPGVAGLLLVFGTAEVGEVVLRFLADASLDEPIVAKGIMPELAALLGAELGISIPADAAPDAARRTLRRLLLLGDFVASLPAGAAVPDLEAVPIPAEAGHREAIRGIAAAWRNRADLRAEYVSSACAVEQEVGADRWEVPLDLLSTATTFLGHETRLVRLAEDGALLGELNRVVGLADARALSFWATQDGGLLLRWRLVSSACRLILLARNVREDSKAAPKDPALLVRRYTEGETRWCRLDTLHRHLERQFADFEVDPRGDHESLERLVHLARREYMSTLDSLAEALTAAVETAGFQWGDLPRQPSIFSRFVRPALDAGGKVAYVWVDALRFEMARELVDGIGERYSAEVAPAIAALPTITPLGMAALAPQADLGLALVEAGKTAAAQVADRVLKSRPDRLAWIQEQVSGPVAALKLDDVLKPSKATKAKVAEAQCVVVTSQELDDLSGDEYLHLARQVMDSILDHLRRAVRNLAALGVTQVVLTADHGHIFGEEIESGMKVDPPGGKTLELHRRAWIGKGGDAAPGVLRVPAAALGLGGDLEVAFPRGLACFKVKGAGKQFFHGGISLQEIVIPVVVVRAAREAPAAGGRPTVSLVMERKRVTTRFFSVTLAYEEAGLFASEVLRVRVLGRANRKDVAAAAMAAYGYEPGTQEVRLERGKPNPVTMMLTGEVESGALSVHVVDSSTQVELGRLEGIQVALAI